MRILIQDYSGIGSTGGSIGTYDVQTPGNLSTMQTATFTLSAPGPNPTQSLPHEHEVIPDPSGKFVLVPDLGADLIRVFSVSNSSQELIPSSTLQLPPGSGPRHGVFVRTKEETYFYILMQISNMLFGFEVKYDRNGRLSFENVSETNLLRRLNGSLIVMGPNTQNASELHVSVRLPFPHLSQSVELTLGC